MPNLLNYGIQVLDKTAQAIGPRAKDKTNVFPAII